MIDEQLSRRIERATDDARRVLGRPSAPPGTPRAPELAVLIAALADGLGADRRGPLEEHEATLARLHQRFRTRFVAIEAVQTVVGELREITAPSTMLVRAPGALCEGSNFSRGVVSLLSGGRMVVEATHFEGDPSGARAVFEQLRSNPIRLEYPLIETEVLRRRRATIVVDAQVHPRVDRRFAQLMGWRFYAAAPLVVESQVIGVIHADRGQQLPLDVLDRDVLWEFASGLAQAYESAGLRRTLRLEREQLRQFLEWLNARSGELTDAPITLATRPKTPLPPPQPLDGPAPVEGRDDRLVFEGLLTRRELDVLRLLADGSSNRAIADALVVSTGTVKFHVNSILRKLHASNRAEAVSRYLRLLGMPPP